MRTYDYGKKLFELINKNHVEALQLQPVRLIPVGEVLEEIQQKALAGEIVGEDGKPLQVTLQKAIMKDKELQEIQRETMPFTDIEQFFLVDKQHPSAGWAGYTAAATIYSAVFQEPPHGLDWSAYNTWPDGYNVRSQDNQHFVEIDETLAQLTNDMIWEVLTRDSYWTGVEADTE